MENDYKDYAGCEVYAGHHLLKHLHSLMQVLVPAEWAGERHRKGEQGQGVQEAIHNSDMASPNAGVVLDIHSLLPLLFSQCDPHQKVSAWSQQTFLWRHQDFPPKAQAHLSQVPPTKKQPITFPKASFCREEWAGSPRSSTSLVQALGWVLEDRKAQDLIMAVRWNRHKFVEAELCWWLRPCVGRQSWAAADLISHLMLSKKYKDQSQQPEQTLPRHSPLSRLWGITPWETFLFPLLPASPIQAAVGIEGSSSSKRKKEKTWSPLSLALAQQATLVELGQGLWHPCEQDCPFSIPGSSSPWGQPGCRDCEPSNHSHKCGRREESKAKVPFAHHLRKKYLVTLAVRKSKKARSISQELKGSPTFLGKGHNGEEQNPALPCTWDVFFLPLYQTCLFKK